MKLSFKRKSKMFCLMSLFFTIAVIISVRQSPANLKAHEWRCQELPEIINNLFSDFIEEKFQEQIGITEESGWLMTLPSGRQVPRSFLQRQAVPIIAIGREAVPHLFNWVMYDNLAIQYIAIYSLQEITGIKPMIPYFYRDGHCKEKEKAIQLWKNWYLIGRQEGNPK